MSDQIEVKARLTATNEASPVIRQLKRDVDALAASLKKAFSVNVGTELSKGLQRVANQHGEIAGQVRRQVAGMQSARDAQRRLNSEFARGSRLSQTAARAHARQQAAALDYDKTRLSFALRMSRQRDREAAQAEREHQATVRRYGRERAAAGRDTAHHGRRVGSNLNSARNRLDGQFFSSPVFYAMASGSAIGAGVASSFRARMKTNTAETNLAMFGGLSPDVIKALRKDWGDKTAIKYGFNSADFLNVATEVLKAGIPESAMRAVSEMAMQAASGLDLDVAETMKLAGRAATLTQDMKSFDPNAIKEIMNGIAVAAKETAADASEIVEANRRGSGVLATSKMSMTQLSAFTASGISGAMQSGRAGTFMGFLVNEIVNAKGSHGQRGRDLQKAFGVLGMGGKASAARMMADNPTETIMNMLERMGGMDEVKRGEVADLIGMREWRDELLIMVKVRDDIRRTLTAINKQPGFLDEASGLKISSLAGRWKSLVASMTLLWENVGAGFETSFIQLSNTLNGIGDKFDPEFFKRHVEHAVNGFVRGFGYDTFAEAFRSLFGGASGALDIRGLDRTFRFFKGFAEGLKSVGSFVAGILKGAGALLGIDTSKAEGLGEVAAKLIGLSMAMHFARPAFALIGAFKDVVLSVAAAFMTLRGLGLLGGALGGAAVGALSLSLAGVMLVGGALAVAIMNWDAIKKGKEAVTDFWDFSRNGPQDPEWQKRIEDAKRQQKGPFETLGRALKELFGISSAKAGELPEGFKRSAADIRDSIDRFGAKVQLASLSGSAASVASSFTGPAASAGRAFEIGGSSGAIGNGRVNAFGLSRKGIIGGGSSGTPGAGLYDAIINAEGTARGGRDPYNTVLGYGRWGSPSKPLTDMTLNEVREFGLQMRRAQLANGMAWDRTSSASGAFQITGNTMADAARALGMDPATIRFTPEVQRQMAAWIARNRGLQAWEGLKSHPGELARARTALAGGGSDVASLGTGLIPVKASGGNTVLMDPRKGFGQAFAGGSTNAGTLAAAKAIVGADIAGGLQRFTGFNDAFHAGRNSKHAFGLAGDFTLKDPTRSAEAAEQLRNMFRAAGLADSMFKVIDEYKNPSGHATSGHLHYQFNYPQAAEQFAAHQRAKALAAQTPQGLASSVPFTPPPARPGGMFDPNAGAGVSGFHAPITIQGANQSPEEIANAVQRRITEAMNWRTHDVESELT